MHVPVGKSLLGLMSAACIVMSAGVPQAAATEIPPTVLDASSPHTAADPALFDPVPATLRLVSDAVIVWQDNAPGVGSSAALALGTNPLQLAIELLTFPYHNIYGVTSAVGDAFTAFLMAGLLPFSIASLVVVDEDEKIPDYVDQVLTNLRGAIPGIFTAIQDEIRYDIGLFAALFNPGASAVEETENAQKQVTTAQADAVLTDADNPIQLLVELATFPYHNAFAITSAVGAAFTDFLMAALLPVSIASLVLVNEDEKIPDYVNSVINNLGTAIPEIFTTIRDEIAYDVSLFQQAFSLIGGQGSSDEEAQISGAIVSAAPLEATAAADDAKAAAGAPAVDGESAGSDDTQLRATDPDAVESGAADDVESGEDSVDISDDEQSVDDVEPEPETDSDEELEDTTDIADDSGEDADIEQTDVPDSSRGPGARSHGNAPDSDDADAAQSEDDVSAEAESE